MKWQPGSLHSEATFLTSPLAQLVKELYVEACLKIMSKLMLSNSCNIYVTVCLRYHSIPMF